MSEQELWWKRPDPRQHPNTPSHADSPGIKLPHAGKRALKSAAATHQLGNRGSMWGKEASPYRQELKEMSRVDSEKGTAQGSTV